MTRVRFIIVSVASVLTPDTVRPKITVHCPTVFESLKCDCPPADHQSAILISQLCSFSFIRRVVFTGAFVFAYK